MQTQAFYVALVWDALNARERLPCESSWGTGGDGEKPRRRVSVQKTGNGSHDLFSGRSRRDVRRVQVASPLLR